MAKKLSADDVLHIAKLAKLELTGSEIKKFQGQLSAVISYISELDEVDTKNVLPTSQTTGLTNVTRKDLASSQNCLKAESATSGTKRVHNNYFVVESVFSDK